MTPSLLLSDASRSGKQESGVRELSTIWSLNTQFANPFWLQNPVEKASNQLAMGSVQFSWPRRVAEGWFTKASCWEHFADSFKGRTAKHTVH